MSNTNFNLVFVGQIDENEYGKSLIKTIAESAYSNRVHITGFVDKKRYELYLQSADAAVQLRSHSRGESSGAVLDCMAYGLPLIVNKNGAMGELPLDMMISLENEFSVVQLKEAIQEIYSNDSFRNRVSAQSSEFIRDNRQASEIAQKYFDTIETFTISAPRTYIRRGLKQIANIESNQTSEDDVIELAKCLSRNNTLRAQKALWIDISSLITLSEMNNEDQKKLEELIQVTEVVRVEFIYNENNQFYYARRWIAEVLKLNLKMDDDIVELNAGDYYLKLDVQLKTSNATNLINSEMNILGINMLQEETFKNNRFISEKELREIQYCKQTFT